MCQFAAAPGQTCKVSVRIDAGCNLVQKLERLANESQMGVMRYFSRQSLDRSRATLN